MATLPPSSLRRRPRRMLPEVGHDPGCIPLGSFAFQAANLLLAISIVVGILDVTALAHADPRVATVIVLEIIGAWAIFTGEPIARFWLASRNLPAVQRARMRFLSFGFAVLIAILFISVLGGSAFRYFTGQARVGGAQFRRALVYQGIQFLHLFSRHLSELPFSRESVRHLQHLDVIKGFLEYKHLVSVADRLRDFVPRII